MSFSNLEQLYRQVIMDHYKNPRNKGLLQEDGYHEVHLKNPTCGDDITVQIKVEDGKIRYALGAIKGVSAASMASIVAEREKNGYFKDISDFCHRIDIKDINRKQLEQLIKSGSFDSIDKNRAMLYANIETIIKNIYSATELKTSEQTSLFGTAELVAKIKLNQIPDWPQLERLRHEAGAIGFYLSAHPLDMYKESLEKLGVRNCADIIQNIKVGDNIKANIAVCVESYQTKISKNGNKYAFVGLSDATASFEAFLFSEGIIKYGDIIESQVPVLVKISIDKQNEDSNPRIMINSVKSLDEAITEQAKGLIIAIENVSAVMAIKDILKTDKQGSNKIYIIPQIDNWDVRIELSKGYAFSQSDIIGKIRSVSGVVSVKEI